MTAGNSNYNLTSTHAVLSGGYRAGDFNGIIISEGRIENCNETQRVKYFILYGVCHFFSFIILALRIYTRVFIVKYFGQDDVWILISAVIAWAIIGFDLSYVLAGAGGAHVACIKPAVLVTTLKLKYITDPFYSLALQTIRMSMLTFYLRLSADPTFRRVVHWSMGITWLIFIVLLLVFEFQCTPPSKAWDLTVIYENLYNKYCLNRWALGWVWSVFAILCDCWVLILPLKMLLALRVSSKERIMVIGIFGIGFMACAASIARIPAFKIMNESADPLWDQFNLTVTSVVEWNFSVMAACCPALKPLVGRWRPGLMAKLTQRSGNYRPQVNRASGTIHTTGIDDPSKLENGGSTLAASGSEPPTTPRPSGKLRKLSIFIPGGRLNEFGMAPQMPPGERSKWRKIFGFFQRKRSIAGEEVNTTAGSGTGASGPNIGFWRNKDWSMDMTNNDYCVNARHTHQIPQQSSRKSRQDSVGNSDIPP
ncbi:hypothetical protein TWF970_011347 [Orbilia oligospora]|nr:hypothetical protein TWF970_011347 [Orbilia oligospora]